MWYFSWVLGLGLACTFAILNAIWYEIREDKRKEQASQPR
ncbi:cytochrome bd-I oxidase subunit CydX [Falsirhodobacter sp. alg1]|nr:cytochrome bd-I oxidase subunit CydX [Falsirhodobacter sp. alg1]